MSDNLLKTLENSIEECKVYKRHCDIYRTALQSIKKYFDNPIFNSMEGKLSRTQLAEIKELVEKTLDKTS